MSKLSKNKKSTKGAIVIISIVVIIVIGVVVGFVVIGNKSEVAEQRINNDIEIFKSNDISAINQILFSEPIVPEGFDEFVESPAEKQRGGLMADLISLAEIEILFCKGSSATLSVEAPDMSGFGKSLLSDFDVEKSEEDLKKVVLDYAKTSEKKKCEVSVDYTVENDGVVINYNTEEFLNAITGNFSAGYADIYKEYISALTQEVSDND